MSVGLSAPAGTAVAKGAGDLPVRVAAAEADVVTTSLRMAWHAAEPARAVEHTCTLWRVCAWDDGAALADGASASEVKARAVAAAMAARGGRRMGGRCHLQPTKRRRRRSVALKLRTDADRFSEARISTR